MALKATSLGHQQPYIEYSHEAERGTALTVALVLVVFAFTFIAWAMNRRMAGQPSSTAGRGLSWSRLPSSPY